MSESTSHLLILGAGLTGLTLAYRLRDTGLKVTLLEARERLGGRIHTKYAADLAPREMGATWLGRKHTSLWQLLEELNLGVFEQAMSDRAIYEATSLSPAQLVTLPPNTDPSYRIQGGSSALIRALADTLQANQIQTGEVVEAMQARGNQVEVKTSNGSWLADYVVSTLPPHLLLSTVNFAPALPAQLTEIMAATHTWMGESIKVSLSYAQPFWRAKNLSGTLFSNVGPVTEMYDHANVEDTRYALKGFMNGNYFSMSREDRRELVLKQLEKYYGPVVREYLSYDEGVWKLEPYTSRPYVSNVLPHQHNGHPVYRQAFWGGRLFIAGAETAVSFPGYMDGAVESANLVAKAVGSSAG